MKKLTLVVDNNRQRRNEFARKYVDSHFKVFDIKQIINNPVKVWVETDNEIVDTIPASDSSRGYKAHQVFVHISIDNNILQRVILPMMIYHEDVPLLETAYWYDDDFNLTPMYTTE